VKFVKEFLKLEASTGIFLGLAAVLAILFKNSDLQGYYDALIGFPVNFSILGLEFTKTLVVWVNDFLMSFFFLIIGLELKREFQEGHLKNLKDVMLPGIAALGGLIFPALIYVSFTYDNPETLKGWAIPAATDIAFAMGVLALLGNRVPKALKICLLSLAIFDDIAAILIIAAFYTNEISVFWVLMGILPIVILALFNYKQVNKITPYMIIGLILWVCVLKSGIHATVAGILLGFFIPLKNSSNQTSPLKKLEHQLHPWVIFFILPTFAFFNAGVPLKDISLSSMSHPIAAGIAIGLFLGKQAGVMLFSYFAMKLKVCHLPPQTSLLQFYGMAIVTGIGFTMSLFIGALSFSQAEYQNVMKLGVIAGSTLSGILGYLVLLYSTRNQTVDSRKNM
jgi:NhaA family Na+:H+ antiporter